MQQMTAAGDLNSRPKGVGMRPRYECLVGGDSTTGGHFQLSSRIQTKVGA